MKLSMICFSLTGYATGSRLKEAFRAEGHIVTLDKKSRYLDDSVASSTGDWAGKQFEKADALIFIGACGIAVRSIAPHIVCKKTDPAVLVIDECGKFVISLLSGHLGGANDLALRAAEILGAQPVVTTATDLHKQFAVDVFAKRNGAEIRNMTAAKEVSAALLAGKKVGFYSEFPWEGKLPQGLVLCDRDGNVTEGAAGNEALETGKRILADYGRFYAAQETLTEDYGESPETEKMKVQPDASPLSAFHGDKEHLPIGIAVTIHPSCHPFTSTVIVVPSVLTLGLGCKKGKEEHAILDAVRSCLEKNDLYQEAFERIASIDLKKDEKGIHALSEKWQIPFYIYTADELRSAGAEFTISAFVQSVTGVDNVCERSAVLASDFGRLLQKKEGAGGVTTAVAAREWRIHFE